MKSYSWHNRMIDFHTRRWSELGSPYLTIISTLLYSTLLPDNGDNGEFSISCTSGFTLIRGIDYTAYARCVLAFYKALNCAKLEHSLHTISKNRCEIVIIRTAHYLEHTYWRTSSYISCQPQSITSSFCRRRRLLLSPALSHYSGWLEMGGRADGYLPLPEDKLLRTAVTVTSANEYNSKLVPFRSRKQSELYTWKLITSNVNFLRKKTTNIAIGPTHMDRISLMCTGWINAKNWHDQRTRKDHHERPK